MVHRIGIAALLFALPLSAYAHPELGNYLQHRIAVAANGEHVDVHIDVTFDAERSLAERRLMDANGNGALSRAECASYLETLQERSEERVQLTINGTPVHLVTLYAPALDLFDSHDLDRHPHAVRLSFFAAAPCEPGDTITVRDGLWGELPAIMLAEMSETGAITIVPRPAPAPSGAAGMSAANAREITFEVAAAKPAAKPAAKAPRGSACRRPLLSKGRPRGK